MTTPTLPEYPPTPTAGERTLEAAARPEVAAQAAQAAAAAVERGTVPRGGPVALSTITGITRPIAVPIGDELLEVVYRIGENTPELADRLEAAERAGDGEAQLELVFTFLERAVTTWELYDDHGNRLPCTREVFEGRHPSGAPAIPNMLLRAVFLAILTDDGGVGPKAPVR